MTSRPQQPTSGLSILVSPADPECLLVTEVPIPGAISMIPTKRRSVTGHLRHRCDPWKIDASTRGERRLAVSQAHIR